MDEATSARAALIYMRFGIKDVKALKGGWAAWLAAGGASKPSPDLCGNALPDFALLSADRVAPTEYNAAANDDGATLNEARN